MNDLTKTTEKLRDFIVKQFAVAQRADLADDDSLIERGIIDSMGVLELVTFVESEFDIVLEDDEVAGDNFESIETLAAFVTSKLALLST